MKVFNGLALKTPLLRYSLLKGKPSSPVSTGPGVIESMSVVTSSETVCFTLVEPSFSPFFGAKRLLTVKDSRDGAHDLTSASEDVAIRTTMTMAAAIANRILKYRLPTIVVGGLKQEKRK